MLFKTFSVFLISTFLLSQLCGQDQKKDHKTIKLLSTSHPYIILKDERLNELKSICEKDPLLQRYINNVIEKADSYLKKKPLAYKKIGPRLLHVSRDCLDRTYSLCLAWRFTQDIKYAEKAKGNMFTVCAFADWNPSHFLDTAEMSHAVGIGYDWLYSYLDKDSREKIKEGLIRNGLKPGFNAYKKKAWWASSNFNWNQVCNSGLLIGALSIMDSDPEYAETIIPKAVKSLPIALRTYDPDGAWPEGPGYWNYATSYTVFGLAAMKSALGHDFDLSDSKGFSKCGLFPIYHAGPKNLYINFADSGERSRKKTLPALFWLAKRYDEPLLAFNEKMMLRKYKANPLHVIWYAQLPSQDDLEAAPLDKHFTGPVETAVFRSSWDDENALFVGIKAGYNQVNHGHLDLGNFEFDALAKRWIRDLGSDNYNLPGYWDKKKGGKRWAYYRLNSFSHNVTLFNNENQDPDGTAKIIKFGKGFAVVDYKSAYKKWTDSAKRGLILVNKRKALIVQDEFKIKTRCNAAFGVTTDAEILTDAKGGARLILDGEELIAKILSPKGAIFTVDSAEQIKPQKSNKGVNRLMIRLSDLKGEVCIAVLFSPVYDGKPDTQIPEVKPLAEW